MIKKVLVTGANGMLGTHICEELLKQHYDVYALVLPRQKGSIVHNNSIRTIEGDILDLEYLTAIVADVDAVIHVAALTDVWPR
jgi:nucleoside-diphosphate-sugar epimerase